MPLLRPPGNPESGVRPWSVVFWAISGCPAPGQGELFWAQGSGPSSPLRVVSPALPPALLGVLELFGFGTLPWEGWGVDGPLLP